MSTEPKSIDELIRLAKESASQPRTWTADPAVEKPAHYTQGKVECIDALEAATVGLEGIEAVCTGAAMKYLWRWKRKGGRQDLLKARWYLDRLLQVVP